jgi:phospholipase D1/2
MQGDRDSEIAVVIEDLDMIPSTMNGKKYQAARFAATFRRQLFKEHLGLIPPQSPAPSSERRPTITPNMRPPAIGHDMDGADGIGGKTDDAIVADPLSDQFEQLWKGTAQNNTEILQQLFKTVPNNLVRNWKEYDVSGFRLPSFHHSHHTFLLANRRHNNHDICVNNTTNFAVLTFLLFTDFSQAYLPNIKPGHVAAVDLSAEQVLQKLNQVKGHLVEGVIDFLSEETGLVEGVTWSSWDFLLPLYV